MTYSFTSAIGAVIGFSGPSTSAKRSLRLPIASRRSPAASGAPAIESRWSST